MSIYSSRQELEHIQRILCGYLRLPFSTNDVPGRFLEAVLAHVREGSQLGTYDYIDVYHPGGVGWSVKSTKAETPLTWKRAKIANKEAMIAASRDSSLGTQRLGDAIIEFCNAHARHSIEHYRLSEIGYARLIVFKDGRIRYFERQLCTRDRPDIFNPADFTWKWSTQKVSAVKEQLSALHGFNVHTGDRWWAWHGLGENQLHFTGERAWWPSDGDIHAISFQFPEEASRVSLERLTELLDAL